MFTIDKDNHQQDRKTTMSSRPPENYPQNSRRHTIFSNFMQHYSLCPCQSESLGWYKPFILVLKEAGEERSLNSREALSTESHNCQDYTDQVSQKTVVTTTKKVFKSSKDLSLDNFIFKNLEY